MRQIIFSLDQTNKRASREVIAQCLSGLKVQPCKGCYKGQIERSYITSIINIERVIEICRENNQESILIIDNCVGSLLYLKDLSHQPIEGKWAEVDSTKGLDAYTEINGRIYSFVS